MIFEHEIPSGSRLYFGQSAKVKRDIEYKASGILEDLNFQEIVTPIFSYHQHESFNNQKELIRVNDEDNHNVTLRADSTADVVRIVTKRLGRSMENKRWFYIQPTLSFPTIEQYQIGAEIIDGSFAESANITINILKKLNINPILQITNIKIPQILHDNYGVDLDILKSMSVEKILALNIDWISDLVSVHRVEDLDTLKNIPDDIAIEIDKIKEAIKDIDYKNIVISPLYYAKMRYYNSLTFRIFEDNGLLARGGIYNIDDIKASGFALYSDECITNIMKTSKGI
jgi:histidyl-tRNA synthetase